jgi:DNA-binding NtrC family response regulator
MDGVEVYRRLKQIDPAIVAIIVTAYAASETAKAALAAGAWDLLPKPVDLRRLMPLVEDSVHRPLILLVDDDRELCQRLWDVLRERRYRTCLAYDTDEALALLEKRSFDVALIDLRLPKGSGEEVLRELRAKSAGTGAVLITGHPDDLPAPGESHYGQSADQVLTKPLDIDRVLNVLKQGRRRLTQSGSAK